MNKISCATCANEFYVKTQREADRRKFCSNKCSDWNPDKRKRASDRAIANYRGANNPNFSNAQIKKTCKVCSGSFLVWRNELNGGKKKGIYCSQACYVAHRKSGIDPVAKRLYAIHSRNISRSVKDARNRCKWTELAGYSVHDLRTHLESLFGVGMNWGNYGRHGWHIDHIRPISTFSINGYSDSAFKECWALENLQPMWGGDNIRKGGINRLEVRIKYNIARYGDQ